MKSPLHILHLEDNPSDSDLVQYTLEVGGIPCVTTRVDGCDDFLAALEKGGIELVLADFSLPGFDGLSAVKIVRSRWPELPVILVSGTVGEEVAIDSLKSGATDYVLKERLARLAPAVRRAMQDVEEHAERSRLEAQFIEAQKMEVIGQLAGGVAHDFNNILAVIMGYSDLLMEDLPPNSLLREYAEEIQHVAERAAGLTRQLLVFSRKETVQPVVLDLNVVVKDLEKMLRRLIGRNISMSMVLGKETGRIKADSGYVGQVLMNLVVNARDAMPNGGQLTITTCNVTLDENHARAQSGAQPGDYVILSVADTGTGMTSEVRARLFEAFFTTKPIGRGTGLGLATCQTIVQLAGGHIGVESEVGQGSILTVHFPRIEQTAEATVRPTQTGPLPRGTETLLLVEDEPAVRQLARSVLESQGYEVLSAANGQEALQIARAHQGSPIRLMITDFILPLIEGKMMSEWRQITGSQPSILFTSAFTDDSLLPPRDGGVEVEFLPKPYMPATLARKVRELLDKRIAPHSEPGKGSLPLEGGMPI